jgi:cytochrome c biogenesis protein CcdA
MFTLIGSSAFGAAALFGFRHGFDWDHLAALTDLTGSQAKARRAMRMATLYVVGHAIMILVLGTAAILFGSLIPNSVNTVAERVIGLSLIGLSCWIIWTTVRTGGAPPMRSRWMLLIDALRRVKQRRDPAETPVVVEHVHPHSHDGAMHDHGHAPALVAESAESAETAVTKTELRHAHKHRHIVVPPRDPFLDYTGRSAFAIGLLHGIGAETPTQVVLFVSAANATGRASSIGLLLSFVLGLAVANTLVASASTFGFQKVLRYRLVTTVVAGLTALFGMIIGIQSLVG